MTDAGGLPLAITLTGVHRNDVTRLLPLVDRLSALAEWARPDRLLADRGYDHDTSSGLGASSL